MDLYNLTESVILLMTDRVACSLHGYHDDSKIQMKKEKKKKKKGYSEPLRYVMPRVFTH